jgi:hypothetical protein
LKGISLWDFDLNMYVIFGETEFVKLKAKAFQIPECLDTGIDVALFSEVSVSFVGSKTSW